MAFDGDIRPYGDSLKVIDPTKTIATIKAAMVTLLTETPPL